jgi:L-arabinokinase
MSIPLRRLADIETSEDRASFLPALARFAALRSDPDPRLAQFFSTDAATYIARAPGRLDVMGGIADYSGALVLQLPLARSTFAILQRQAADRCDVVSHRGGGWDFFDVELAPVVDGALRERTALAAWFARASGDRWAAYVVGVVQHCLQRATDARRSPMPGLKILIESDVPEGKGVSSSAALEVATMAAVSAAYGLELDATEIAAACQLVENEVVGAPCGIMDQMTSAHAPTESVAAVAVPTRNHRRTGRDSRRISILRNRFGLRLCRDGRPTRDRADGGVHGVSDHRRHRWIAGAVSRRAYAHQIDMEWLPLTNIPPTEFSERFEQLLPETMSGAEFLTRYHGITDTVTRVDRARQYPVRRSTAHPILEQARVQRFADLLGELPSNRRAATELGQLMYASHASYGAIGLGSVGTDRLVELVAGAGPERGVFGAKITGGGSGGTVAVIGTDDAEATVREIAARYSAESGLPAEVFVESGPGAEETGVLLI